MWKYLNYGPRVEQHRTASRAYGNLVREVDQWLQTDPAQITDAVLSGIRQKNDEIDIAAPNVAPAIWAWAVAGVAKERDDPQIDPSTIDRGLWSRVRRVLTRLFG